MRSSHVRRCARSRPRLSRGSVLESLFGTTEDEDENDEYEDDPQICRPIYGDLYLAQLTGPAGE